MRMGDLNGERFPFSSSTLSPKITLKLVEIMWKRKRGSQRGTGSLYRVHSELGFVQEGKKQNVSTRLVTFRTTGTSTDLLIPSKTKNI